jgi:hypothetical protein
MGKFVEFVEDSLGNKLFKPEDGSGAPEWVIGVYFGTYGVYRPRSSVQEVDYRNMKASFEEEFQTLFPADPTKIYNATLAGHQSEVFEAGLLAAGFRLVEESKNPNTGNKIHLYVWSAGT